MITLAFLCVLNCETIGDDKTNHFNNIDKDIYYCYLDPRVDELFIFAVQEKDLKISREILENLLEIRPNCIDVYKSLLFIAAIENKQLEFQKLDFRIRTMETEYKLITGKTIPEIEKKDKPLSQSSKSIYINPPPKKDKINYWKWLYIYERIRNKSNR
jgi:hypothetical protein